MAVQLDEHRTVNDFWRKATTVPLPTANTFPLDASTLRQLCLDAGADDAGFVERDRAEIAESSSAHEYRQKVSGAETISMWQSLPFGANYKAAYCMAVCPAGEDVIGPFLTDRKQFLQDTVKPLQEKAETIYIVPGSDAEVYVARRFPHKKTKRVSNGLAGQGTIRAFLRGLNFAFQRGKSVGLNATYHFTFTGQEEVTATVVIRDKTLEVSEGHTGTADFRLTADSQTWLRFLRKETNLVWALLRRKVRIHGSPKLLLAFARCFPS